MASKLAETAILDLKSIYLGDIQWFELFQKVDKLNKAFPMEFAKFTLLIKTKYIELIDAMLDKYK